jgi:uncharacterized protein YjeT (DUF2065 family)
MTEDQAKQRFIALTLLRVFGLGLVIAGAANITGAWMPQLAPSLGYVLLVIGALDFFLIPALLKKAWRDQP